MARFSSSTVYTDDGDSDCCVIILQGANAGITVIADVDEDGRDVFDIFTTGGEAAPRKLYHIGKIVDCQEDLIKE